MEFGPGGEASEFRRAGRGDEQPRVWR
jgi:hypothetical protein